MRTVIRRTIVMATAVASLTALAPAVASAQSTQSPANICFWVSVEPVYKDWVCIVQEPPSSDQQ